MKAQGIQKNICLITNPTNQLDPKTTALVVRTDTMISSQDGKADGLLKKPGEKQYGGKY